MRRAWPTPWGMAVSDRLYLKDLHFMARHGVLHDEQTHPQRFSVDVTLSLDLAPAGRTDRLAESVDYRWIWSVAKDVMLGPPRQLLETLAQDLADRLLVPPVREVCVLVKKLDPPLPDVGGWAGAEVTRHA